MGSVCAHHVLSCHWHQLSARALAECEGVGGKLCTRWGAGRSARERWGAWGRGVREKKRAGAGEKAQESFEAVAMHRSREDPHALNEHAVGADAATCMCAWGLCCQGRGGGQGSGNRWVRPRRDDVFCFEKWPIREKCAVTGRGTGKCTCRRPLPRMRIQLHLLT